MRMNFVCHGLMWIVDEGDHIEILIPEVNPHKFEHGDAETGRLHTMPSGSRWELHGVPSSGRRLRDLVCPKSSMVLKKSEFEVLRDRARNAYRVPMPNRIRNFRGAELSDKVFGKTPTTTAVEIPAISYDAICFSYDWPGTPEIIEARPENGPPLSVPINVIYANWGIYAQPDEPEPVEHDIPGMNQLLRLKSSGAHPDFRLSLGTPSDGVHRVARHTGLSETHLKTLLELRQSNSLPETDRSGCHSAYLVN